MGLPAGLFPATGFPSVGFPAGGLPEFGLPEAVFAVFFVSLLATEAFGEDFFTEADFVEDLPGADGEAGEGFFLVGGTGGLLRR